MILRTTGSYIITQTQTNYANIFSDIQTKALGELTLTSFTYRDVNLRRTVTSMPVTIQCPYSMSQWQLQKSSYDDSSVTFLALKQLEQKPRHFYHFSWTHTHWRRQRSFETFTAVGNFRLFIFSYASVTLETRDRATAMLVLSVTKRYIR